MEVISRKGSVIETPFSKYNIWIMRVMLFVTFVFCDIYGVRSQFFLTVNMMSSMLAGAAFATSFSMFILMLLFNALLSTVLLEVFLSVYYFFAFQALRRFMPLTNIEFKECMRPFMVLRNLIWIPLSLLMLLPSGYFIGIGTEIFEVLATMIVIFPAFFFVKKHYVKEGYGARVLVAFVFPYILLNLFRLLNVVVFLR